MEPADLTALDAAATLAATGERVRARRAGEVEDLLLVLQWCDLHSADPQATPGAVPKSRGGDYLRQIGGDGTPAVSDLCLAEYAIARGAGEISTSNFAADALDLRHRLPMFWAAVQALEVEAWVARRVARMARKLTQDRVGLVDAAMHAARHQPPGRLIEIAEAKIIEADPDLHRAKLAEDATKTGVWLSKPRPGDLIEDDGEPATLRLTSKLPAGTAVRCDENLDDLATAIYDHTATDPDGNRPTHAQCRQTAFEMLLSEPDKAAAFLAAQDTDPAAPEPAPPKPRRPRRPAEIVVHLTDTVISGEADGVARVEDLGPVLIDQLSDLLQGRDLTVQPVIDLNTITSARGYEHPAAMRRRTLLRTGGDVFPHSTSRTTRRLDHDHPTPYNPTGPPGQTSDLNDAPLTRRHHRAKTHLPYRCDQIALAAYRWTTPHGLARLVTPTGTREIDILHLPDGTPAGEIYTDGPPIELRLRT